MMKQLDVNITAYDVSALSLVSYFITNIRGLQDLWKQKLSSGAEGSFRGDRCLFIIFFFLFPTSWKTF